MSGGPSISTSETRLEALQIQSSAYGVTLAMVYGRTRISGNLMWYGDFKATPHTQSGGGKGGGGGYSSTTYTYSASAIMGLAEGTISDIPIVWKAKKIYGNATINGVYITALAQVGLSLSGGAIGQAPWSYLSTFTPSGGSLGSQSLGYSGISYVYAQDYQLGSSTNFDNHSFEVVANGSGAVAGYVDADPSYILSDVLTNGRAGAGYPAGKIADFTAWGSYVRAAYLLMSPAFDTQTAAGDIVTRMGQLTNTAPVWTYSGLKMVPYGDTALTNGSYTFTPNVTPVYDLTDDEFTPTTEGGDPITVSRKPQSDAYNSVRIEFLNRANYYNVEIATAEDSANIDAFGRRQADVITAHWICDSSVAQNVAQLILQRLLYVRNTYKFTVPWTKALLEPMDLVTLTDTGLGFNKLPVRVIEITESESGDLDIVAEEFPLGVANAATYGSQASAGFQHNYNAAPGSVATPFLFEAPNPRTTTGLEVYAAIKGVTANWGGARIWVSYDGTNYKEVGRIYGPARYGVVAADFSVSSPNPQVTLNSGQLISGSAADAANLSTLCYVGGANPEYFAYTTAALVSGSTYNLGGMNRRAFSTNQALALHSFGDPFVRIDDAIGKSGPLDTTLVGKTIYFKFTSFNIYQANEESLAAVSPYAYSVTGAMLRIQPSTPTGLAAAMEPFGVRLTCNANTETSVKRYEYRVGGSWDLASVIAADGGTNLLWKVQAAGTYTIWIAAVDNFGNYSSPTSINLTISAPSIAAPTAAIVNTDLQLSWVGTPGSFAIAGYEIRYGVSFGAGTYIGTRQATSYTEKIMWPGSRTYWVAPYDVNGNYGTPMSAVVVVAAPSAPTAFYNKVVDNNILAYWTASSVGSGQLPIDRYEIRSGTSWATGTPVGSNGTSTFTVLFEQVGGTYTYWIAAVDTAGTFGAAVSSVAFVNQPPDYILRANYNSIFSTGGVTVTAALTNAIQYMGGLLLPVNATESWSQHFQRSNLLPAGNVNAWSTYVTGTAAGTAIVVVDPVYGPVVRLTKTAGTTTDRFGFRFDVSTMSGSAYSGSILFKPNVAASTGQLMYVDAVKTAGGLLTTSRAMTGTDTVGTWAQANISTSGATLAGTAACYVWVDGAAGSSIDVCLPALYNGSDPSWTNPLTQITAGNPIYIEPSQGSATYQEVIDYGSTLPATNITATLNSTVVSGTVGISCQIDYSNTSATGPWITGPAGATTILASNFRWVRFTYTFTPAGGTTNLLQVNGLNYKLSMKQRTDSGSATITTASAGVAVSFGYPFISADTPIVQPGGNTPLIPVVNYVGGVNPTGFTVYLYTLAGAQATGSFSWSVRGY